jgi:hypothetical protein
VRITYLRPHPEMNGGSKAIVQHVDPLRAAAGFADAALAAAVRWAAAQGAALA